MSRPRCLHTNVDICMKIAPSEFRYSFLSCLNSIQIVYKAILSRTPSHIYDLIIPPSPVAGRLELRSISRTTAVLPLHRTKFSELAVAGQTVWKARLRYVRETPTLPVFRKRLETVSHSLLNRRYSTFAEISSR